MPARRANLCTEVRGDALACASGLSWQFGILGMACIPLMRGKTACKGNFDTIDSIDSKCFLGTVRFAWIA
jgi:hypothetical protein